MGKLNKVGRFLSKLTLGGLVVLGIVTVVMLSLFVSGVISPATLNSGFIPRFKDCLFLLGISWIVSIELRLQGK